VKPIAHAGECCTPAMLFTFKLLTIIDLCLYPCLFLKPHSSSLPNALIYSGSLYLGAANHGHFAL